MSARLSQGERARVAIARAVAAKPTLLLADEPTSRLDGANAIAVAVLLAQLARDTGCAVVCSTHDPLVIEQADSPRLPVGGACPERADSHGGEARVATIDLRQSTIFSRLRGLLEVTRLVRTGEELPELPLGDRAHRLRFARLPHGRRQPLPPRVGRLRRHHGVRERRGARGSARQRPPAVPEWEPLLDQRFLQRGAYFVPLGEFDWSAHEDGFTPDLAVSARPERLASGRRALRAAAGADGQLLGILSVDEPLSGRKPSGDEIDVLIAVSEHAAIAVQAAQEARERKGEPRGARAPARRLDAPERDLGHDRAASARLRRDLGGARLRKVAVQLLHATDGVHHTVASVGFGDGENIGAVARPPTSSSACSARVRRGRLLPDPAGPRAASCCRTARSGYTLAARRTRAARLAEPLAVRAAPGSSRPPHRLHLGRRPASTACAPTRSACRSCARSQPGATALEPGVAVRRDSERYEHHRALIDARPSRSSTSTSTVASARGTRARSRDLRLDSRSRRSAGAPARARGRARAVLANLARVRQRRDLRDLDARLHATAR